MHVGSVTHQPPVGLLDNALVGSVTLWERLHGTPFVGPVVCPSGSSLPSALRLGFFGSRSPSPSSSVAPAEGRAQSGWWGWPSRGSRSVPPPLPFVQREEGEGGAAGASASGNGVASCSVYRTFCFYIDNFR